MSDTLLLLALLATPLGLVLLTRGSSVRYGWGDTALTVRAGLRRYRFPYRSTAVRFTTTRLGERLVGVAAPGTYVGSFAFAGVPRNRVIAIADRNHGPALLLQHGGKWHYLTPPEAGAVVHRFAGPPASGLAPSSANA